VERSDEHFSGYSAKEYFQLVEDGLIAPDERVELLDGLIVAMSPQNPAHAATAWHVHGLLSGLIGERAIVRSQLPLIVGTRSVPEPDVAVVPWSEDRWQLTHPDRCLLAIEIADRTLLQDRLTKCGIYAAAGIDHYWIVNLRSRRVEWFAQPSANAGVYASAGAAEGDVRLPPTSLGLVLTAGMLFPPLPRPPES
jgi:Uma2 family endonuclease